jgi:YD repeat-containing protein
VIENSFDESGRLAHQIVRWPDADEPYTAALSYVVEGGSIVQTDFTENGQLTRFRYNKSHYILSETIDPDGPAPITVNYNRNETTNFSSGMTVSCAGPKGAITRTSRLPAGVSPLLEDSIQEELIREQCVTRDR